MKAQINISFDVEDIYGDQTLLNDTLYELLKFCDEKQIYVDVYITAIRYISIKQSNKLLALFNKSNYVNIGYHSNSHSFLTIPEQNSIEKLKKIEEYNFDCDTEKLTKKKGGIIDFLNDNQTQMFRCPGFSWTPDYFDFMKEYNMRFTTIDIDYPTVLKYKDLIILPTLINALEKIKTTTELDCFLSDCSYKSVYLHPARLIYNHFWDKMKSNTYHIISSREIYSDYLEKIKSIKNILLYIKSKYDIFSLKDIDYKGTISSETKLLEQKLLDSMVSKWNWSQITGKIPRSHHISELKKSLSALELCEFSLKKVL